MSGKWGWFVQEIVSPTSLVVAYLSWNSDIRWDPSTAAIALWVAHYIHRSIIWTVLMRCTAQTTVLVVALAALFNVVNGYLNGRIYSFDSPVESFADVRFIVGLVVFSYGAYVNIRSDYMLRALRSGVAAARPKEKVESDGEKAHPHYAMPVGGWFEYVASANYFGELIEWTGFWILRGFAPAALSFALWTFANLVPRARDTHLLYQDMFRDKYPKSRKAIIPFLY